MSPGNGIARRGLRFLMNIWLSPGLYSRFFARARPAKSSMLESSPARVLVIRTDEIGDAVLTLPLLATLSRRWPDSTVDLILRPAPALLFSACGLVDTVFAWDPQRRPKILNQLAAWSFAKKHLRSREYDLVLLARWADDFFLGRFLAAASLAPRIVGFDPALRPHLAREAEERLLLTELVDPGPIDEHAIVQMERLSDHLGLESAWDDGSDSIGGSLIDDADRALAAELLAEAKANYRFIVALGIGAGNQKREWPISHFAEFLDALAQRRPITCILLGSSADRERGSSLRDLLFGVAGIDVCDMIGRLTLRETAAVVAASSTFVGCDSGPAHIASSMRTPTLVISCHPHGGSSASSNAPERFGPWSPLSTVVRPRKPREGCESECVGTTAHCIEDVSPNEAILAFEGLVAAMPPTSPEEEE